MIATCVLGLFIFNTFQLKAQVGDMKFSEGQVQHVVIAEEIVWKPCPANLPAGCEMTVLEGNPKGNDLFTVRFKISGEFLLPPHTHPKDERVTVLQGKVYVAFGEKATKDVAKAFGQGDYYVNAKNAVHSVWAEPGTILQITGIGPWEANFLKLN
ncbi:MAG: cupin domain-containing protein [Flavobacteriaceae bacterium]